MQKRKEERKEEKERKISSVISRGPWDTEKRASKFKSTLVNNFSIQAQEDSITSVEY